MSLFRTKSESALNSLVLDPDFAAVIEFERHNKLVDNFILRHLQTNIQATTLADFVENISDRIGSTITAHDQSFPPFISVSPIVTYPESTAGSPSSHTPHIPSTPPTPQTTLPIVTAPVIILPPPPPHTHPTPPPRAMVARFAPLVLPHNLHDMPADYQSKIPMFDGTPQSVPAQQHVDRMTTFFDLYELDEEDVTMRLFVQTFGGEVRKWFRGLAAGSINSLEALERQFLDRWEIRKDSLQINVEYNNLKRNPGESVQDYIIIFNLVYNAIPDDLKPSRKSALLKFLDGFDLEMAYSLRDRDPPTLEEMQKIAVSVEANLNDKRARMKAEKKVTIKEEVPSTSQVIRKMEEVSKALQNLSLGKPEPQVRNPNFRGQQQQPQYRIKQRETRAQEATVQQPIQPPFQQNYVTQESEDEGEGPGEENHFFTPDDMPTYITEEEELVSNAYTPQDEHYILSNDVVLQDESEEYQRGYLHALSAQQGQQRQLRNRTVPIHPIQKRAENLAKNGAAVPQRKGKEVMDPTSTQTVPANKMDQPSNVPKDRAEKRDNPAKESEKSQAFSIENEVSKLKLSIPLTEIMKNTTYRAQISKMFNTDPMLDAVNVEDDQPELIFGPALNGESPESDVPPFYISLRIHDYVLHNAMFDSGASHNLMPKAIMEKLGLDITRKYHDLYSFDSSRVRCIGLIKDLVVSLDQIPAKNLLMDVVVADIPPRFGMLLSRSWGSKLKGTLQLDFSYATIPVFGQMRKVYREQKMKYMITSKEKPVNHPVNYVQTDLESYVLFVDSFNEVDSQLVQIEDIPGIAENFREVLRTDSEERTVVIKSIAETNGQQVMTATTSQVQPLEDDEDGLWTMDFDGAVGSDGSGIGVCIRSPFSVPNRVPSKVQVCSYKLAFDCSNNEAEYEALIAGLKILQKLKTKKIAVYGDSELVIKQVKGEFQAKHPRMRAYRNAVLDILKRFSEYTLTCVPRIQNGVADALAKATSNLKIPMNSSNKFEIYVKHRPTIPDNQRSWKVFQDDEEIKDFLHGEGKFEEISIDMEPKGMNQMDVLQLKDNHIPKGLIPLEELFDQDDVARKPPASQL